MPLNESKINLVKDASNALLSKDFKTPYFAHWLESNDSATTLLIDQKIFGIGYVLPFLDINKISITPEIDPEIASAILNTYVNEVDQAELDMDLMTFKEIHQAENLNLVSDEVDEASALLLTLTNSKPSAKKIKPRI